MASPRAFSAGWARHRSAWSAPARRTNCARPSRRSPSTRKAPRSCSRKPATSRDSCRSASPARPVATSRTRRSARRWLGSFENIGIKATPLVVDRGTWSKVVGMEPAQRTDNMGMVGRATAGMDYTLYRLFFTGVGANRTGYSNPRVDALLKEGRAATDPTKQKEIYGEIQEIVWNDQPFLFLWYQTQAIGRGQPCPGSGGPAERDAGLRQSDPEVRFAIAEKRPCSFSNAWAAPCRRSFAVSLLVFLFVDLIPGDPAQILAGPTASNEEIESIRKFLGLNEPLARRATAISSGASGIRPPRHPSARIARSSSSFRSVCPTR